MKTMSIL